MKIDNTNTTFCTGFWYIPQNKKHKWSHYKKWMPKTLRMLENQNLVFFHNKDFPPNPPDNVYWTQVRRFLYRNLGSPFNPLTNTDIIYKEKEVVDLPTYSISLGFLEACKRQNNITIHPREKGAIHYAVEYKKSGEESFRKVLTVWTSKLFLLKNIALQNPFDTEYFAWSDISISRLNNRRVNWNFLEYEFSFDNPIGSFFYPNLALYRGEKVSCAAGFMLFNRDSIVDLVDRYERKIDHLINDSYAHDEETIIHEIYKDRPAIFGIIGSQ